MVRRFQRICRCLVRLEANGYLRDEFKAHGKAEDQYFVPFMESWIKYLDGLRLIKDI